MKLETLIFVGFLVGWVWLVNKIGMEWFSSLAHEQDRLKEAELVGGVSSVCSTWDGARLGFEFLKCNEARALIENKNLVWMRAFERTISNVAVQTIQAAGSMTFSALGHIAAFALVASGLTLMFNELKFRALRYSKRSTGEIDMYSPIAQARRRPAYIEMGQLLNYDPDHEE